MFLIYCFTKFYLRPPPLREPPPPREPPPLLREPPLENPEPRDWLPMVERELLLRLLLLLLRDTDERFSVVERLYDGRLLLLLLFVLISFCCCVVLRVLFFTFELLFSRTALFTLVFVLLFVRTVFLLLLLLRVRSFVTPLRVTLLRVLLGRSYTRWALFVRRMVRPFCSDEFLLLRAIVPERTPASALDGPVARGTYPDRPPPLRLL